MVHASTTATTATSLDEPGGGSAPHVSVVVTIYDEEQSIPLLLEQLRASLDAWGRPWEAVLVDDDGLVVAYEGAARRVATA